MKALASNAIEQNCFLSLLSSNHHQNPKHALMDTAIPAQKNKRPRQEGRADLTLSKNSRECAVCANISNHTRQRERVDSISYRNSQENRVSGRNTAISVSTAD